MVSENLMPRVLSRALQLGMNQTALAQALGETRQTISNWKSRGVPADKFTALADVLNWSMDELLGREKPVARPVILDGRTVVPQLVWETLMKTTLPPVFQVAAPDASMSPRIHEGTLVQFSTGMRPKAGDGVLVQDAAGQAFIRVFRERSHGRWEAHPLNEAYRPLDSQDDQLTVLAVLTGVMGRWA